MRKTRMMPIMAHGGNVSSRGLSARRKLLVEGGRPSDSVPEDAGLTTGPGVSPYNWAQIPQDNADPAAAVAGSSVNWKGIAAGAGKLSDAVMPYASNIVNAFRRPPMPPDPQLINPVTLSKIRLDSSRNQVRNAARAQDINADRSLDEQSAAAVRSSNLSKTLNQEGQISEQEAFLNARQRAESAGMNLNVDSMNTAAVNNQANEKVQRRIAIDREQSQNFANASDKYISMGNERAKANLDLKKLNTLSQMWKESGVYDRMMKRIKKGGNEDPTGVYGQMGWLGDALEGTDHVHKAMGGTLSSPMAGKHPTRNDNLHRGLNGMRKIMAEGGMGPGKFTPASIAAAKASGYDDASMADNVNTVLIKGSYPGGILAPEHRSMYDDANIYRQTHPGMNPEAMISGYYGRPVNPSNPTDMLRGRLRNLNNDPVANYRATPNIDLQPGNGVAMRAFGGYRASLAKGYLSPMGNTRSIGMGPGIMKDKYNPKHISHVPHNMLAMGGPKTDGSKGDDLTFTNYGDATPDVYRDGGPWQEEWAMGGLKPKLLDHSMWRQPYKENALTNNDPNPYMDMGGFDYSGETTARDMSMWNRKQWMDESVGQGQYAGGGTIHIKKANRGKFTAYKARTGKTTTEALHSSDPHVRQMANFARNAKKWHH